MSIYSSAVKKPVSTIMIFLGVVIFGIYSYLQLPVDFFPKIDPPIISVFTFYTGANASDVEQNITRKLEDGFASLTNLKKISSKSKDNISVVTLEFEWGANLDEATNEVRNAVGMAERNLPEGVETPTIFKIITSMMPVIMFTVTSSESYAGIKDILDTKLIQQLNRIEGVGNIIQIGSPIRAGHWTVMGMGSRVGGQFAPRFGNGIRNLAIRHTADTCRDGCPDVLKYLPIAQPSHDSTVRRAKQGGVTPHPRLRDGRQRTFVFLRSAHGLYFWFLPGRLLSRRAALSIERPVYSRIERLD